MIFWMICSVSPQRPHLSPHLHHCLLRGHHLPPAEWHLIHPREISWGPHRTDGIDTIQTGRILIQHPIPPYPKYSLSPTRYCSFVRCDDDVMDPEVMRWEKKKKRRRTVVDRGSWIGSHTHIRHNTTNTEKRSVIWGCVRIVSIPKTAFSHFHDSTTAQTTTPNQTEPYFELLAAPIRHVNPWIFPPSNTHNNRTTKHINPCPIIYRIFQSPSAPATALYPP